jgi:hypothetical protein
VDGIKGLWQRFPEQIRHLLVPLAIVLAGYTLAYYLFVPSDFGLSGHYRASSPQRNVDLPIKYAGSDSCTGCHEALASKKKGGYHSGVACETCHQPAAVHTEDPDKRKPVIAQGRKFCLLCHDYLPSRPTGFPQMVSESHNPQKPCTTCHHPHDPKPPGVVGECGACHLKVVRVVALSQHAGITCAQCHQVPKEHLQVPRASPPKKNLTGDLCASCHGPNAAVSKEIPRIDIKTHGEGDLCWQCHYPHQPEAR